MDVDNRNYYAKNSPTESHASDLNAIGQDYSLTFSPTGFVVLLHKGPEGEKTEYIEPEPVHSWGPDAEPMIFWQNELVNARSLSRFRGIRQGRRVAGVLPGGGWQVAAVDFAASDTDSEGTLPVIAWVVTEMGTAVPIVPAPTGVAPLQTALADPCR
jgi:hypothetical protein